MPKTKVMGGDGRVKDCKGFWHQNPNHDWKRCEEEPERRSHQRGRRPPPSDPEPGWLEKILGLQ